MRFRRPVAGSALIVVSAGLLVTLPASAASADPSPDLVISQVYGGGGNSGATLTNDFVELYNRGTEPASVGDLSIQYGSSSGNFGSSAALVTALPDDAAVAPGDYFLVQMAAGSGGSTALPTPDAEGSATMAAGSGKVALVEGDEALACGASGTPCDDADVARMVDLVGYGSANLFEGSGAAPSLGNTTAALRIDDGRTDTDDNASDFTEGAPDPRNSEYVAPPPPVAVEATVAQVQGAGATSPLEDELVTVEGVVVGDFQEGGQYGGFFIQSLEPDSDPETSEGLRVFQNSAEVAVGDVVEVTGTVSEFFSSNQPSGVPSGTETQIGSSADVAVVGSAPLPAPVELTLPFPAAEDGVNGQERYEGMLVTLPAGLVATDLYTLGRYGEVGLTSGEPLRIPTSESENAANDADQILLDDALSGQNLTPLPYTVDGDGETLPRAGDALAEPVTGVVSFGFGFYRVQPTVGTTAAFDRLNPRTEAPDEVGGDVQVASFNVLNYFTDLADDVSFARGADDANELARQQAKLVSAITALDADVVGLVEIANDDGDAIDTLVAALNDAQADPADHYTAVQAPALNGPNVIGGTYGTDAIRQAIIYRASVVTTVGDPPSDEELLNPADPAFPDEPVFDRPPAVQTFAPVGDEREFTVFVNHFKSKGSNPQPQCGTPDPFGGNCDDLRERQSAALVDLVDQLGVEESALLLGDFNAYEAEEPIEVLVEAGFANAAADLPTSDRYSYSFDGEFGTLDYVFTSGRMTDALEGVDIWHINSPEAVAYDYNDFNQESLYAPDPFASSDHDPVLVGLELNDAPIAEAGGPYTVRVDRNVTLDATGSDDPNGGITAYAWDLDGDGAFDDATGATTSFGEDLPPGYYTVSVQVTDGAETDVDEARVTITTPKGKVPPGRR